MKRNPSVRLAVALLCFGAGAASAAEVAFSYRNHAILSNAHADGDPNEPSTSLLMHENSLQTEYGNYRLGIDFANRLTPDGDRNLNRLTLEKKMAMATLGNWELVAGDSHQELGRGIALSLYRDPVFGLDNTIEGASVRYQPEGAVAGLFVGRVNALRVPVAINPTATSIVDNELLMLGTHANGIVAPDMRLGAHYVFAANRPLESSDFNKNYHTLGATFQQDNIGDEWDIYAESNILVTRNYGVLASDVPNGFGSYGSVSWAPYPWKAKLEVKDYRDYAFEFRRPPTLEEDIIESVNTEAVTASRLSVEHRQVESKTTLFGSYLAGRDRLVNATIHHGVAGSRFLGPLGLEMEARAGYRALPGKSDLAHAALKAKAKTFKGQAAELSYRKLYEHINLDSSPTVKDRNLFDFTYTFSELFNVSVGYEYFPRASETAGNHFFNGGANLRLGSLTTRAFVGKTNGGTLCSGGVCRQIPPYTGAYVETNLAL